MQKLLISLLGGVGVVLAFLAINLAIPDRPRELDWTGAVLVQFLLGTLALYVFYPDKSRRQPKK